jgi:hypothetical protein
MGVAGLAAAKNLRFPSRGIRSIPERWAVSMLVLAIPLIALYWLIARRHGVRLGAWGSRRKGLKSPERGRPA